MPGDMAPAIGPPPDGGVSAWLRVLAYAIICITTLGVQYAFSPLYALLLVELGSPPAETAFVGSLSTGLMDGCGALSGIALERFGYRKTCIMGALMASSGMAIASVCTELWQLYLSYGVLLGIGSSLAFFAPIVIINYWFSRRLSLAHAFANMASATLSLIFGPTATPIFESIGRRNAMLGLAAIMLVLLLSAASLLTTPPPVAVPATTSDAWTAAQAIKTRGGSAEEAAAATTAAESDQEGAVRSPFRAALARPAMRLCLVMIFFYGLAAWIPIVHLVRLCIECGLDTPAANNRLTFLALGSLTLRVPIAAIADRVGRRRVFLCVALVYSALCLTTAFVAGGDGCLGEEASNAAYTAVFGYLCGFTGTMNTLAVSLPSELGISRDEARAGTSLLCSPMGLAFLLGPVIAGALHGVADRYREPMCFAAACLFVCAMLAGLSIRLHGDATPPALTNRSTASKSATAVLTVDADHR